MEDSAQTPTISVIIPMYNAADVLAETLTSVLGQTFGALEVICVDDGSTDATADVARAFARADERMAVVEQRNAGAASARNAGLARAGGTYVCFLDADDLYEPTLLERLAMPLEATGADLAVAEADIFHQGSNDRRPLFRFADDIAEGVHERAEFGTRLFQSFNKTPWNKLYRTSFVRAAGVTFQSLPNMNDLFFVETMLALSKRVCVVREPLVAYRRGRGTSLQDGRHRHPECALLAADALYRGLMERDVLNADEVVSLKNECWRLAIQAIESAAAGKDVGVLAAVLDETRRLSRAWGVDDLRVSQYSVVAYAFWHWCYMRASADGLMWAYDVERAPVAEAQSLASNLTCAVRLLVAALRR